MNAILIVREALGNRTNKNQINTMQGLNSITFAGTSKTYFTGDYLNDNQVAHLCTRQDLAVTIQAG